MQIFPDAIEKRMDDIVAAADNITKTRNSRNASGTAILIIIGELKNDYPEYRAAFNNKDSDHILLIALALAILSGEVPETFEPLLVRSISRNA